jgi:beta-xylosidase
VPVTWIDGWPIIGQPDANNIGHFVWSGRMPILGFKTVAPQTDDEFNEAALPAQWEWNYQPRSDMWSLDQRPGWLRLHAFMPIDGDNFFHAGNTLTQRCLRTVSNEVTIKVSVSGMADGQKAGLCHFARGYSLFGVVQRGTVRYLEFVDHGATMSGPVLTGTDLWLRSTWGLDGVSQYAYSLDGKKYVNFGTPCQLTWGSYRGDRIGIYSFNPKSESGYLDVDFFRYKYAGPAT